MPEVVTVSTKPRIPWNRGRIAGPQPPLKPKHIWALRMRLQLANNTRDLALFNLAVDSKLRGCDLVGLRVSDIYLGDAVRPRATVCQRKTGRPVPFEITEATREALAAWLTARRWKAGDWLFPSRNRLGEHLTTQHYSRLVDRWVALIGLDPSALGTYSLRRTKVALVYKRAAAVEGPDGVAERAFGTTGCIELHREMEQTPSAEGLRRPGISRVSEPSEALARDPRGHVVPQRYGAMPIELLEPAGLAGSFGGRGSRADPGGACRRRTRAADRGCGRGRPCSPARAL